MEITKYANDALESVKQTGFLNEKDWTDIRKMQNELQDTFEKRQIWRTETEMRVSVLNDLHFSTPAAKYWQCVREQGVFFENLVTLSFEYKRNEVQIKRLEYRIEQLINVVDYEEKLKDEDLKIDLEECLFKRKNMEVAARDRVREIRLWSQIKDELTKQDPNFDTNNVDTHQLISYAYSFANDAARVNENTPPADRINLEGKLLTTIKELETRGLLNEKSLGLEYLKFIGKMGFVHNKQDEIERTQSPKVLQFDKSKE